MPWHCFHGFSPIPVAVFSKPNPLGTAHYLRRTLLTTQLNIKLSPSQFSAVLTSILIKREINYANSVPALHARLTYHTCFHSSIAPYYYLIVLVVRDKVNAFFFAFFCPVPFLILLLTISCDRVPGRWARRSVAWKRSKSKCGCLTRGGLAR